MRFIVSGSHGLVGSAFLESIRGTGHSVIRLVRNLDQAQVPDAILWNPFEPILESASLEGADVVVHLAGEPIGNGRWSESKKLLIRESRVQGTTQLCKELAGLRRKPRVLISASAVGIYGDRDGDVLREDSRNGNDFLSEVCRAWEESTKIAQDARIRTVLLRFGVILSPFGGALKRILLPFKMGVGGRIGDGMQYLSWISLDDAVEVIHQVIADPSFEGPVNVVTPNPVTNREFTKTLGRVLWRPTILPLPAFAARWMFGQMADAVLLASQRAIPAKLSAAGYAFKYPELGGALSHVLKGKVGKRISEAAFR